ncbi:MAG TPA: hypothetical protein VJ964_09740 [Balneolaceae bacterium]|nr:hypothetical protein [Balneolaceae bacterium]
MSLLFLAGIGLLAGLYTGIARLGLPIGDYQFISPLWHGPLMINGFLGTLISLERAAALEKPWAFGAPVTFAVASLLLLFGYPIISKPLFIVGSLFLLMIMIFLYRLQAETYHLIMILGAACLALGNIMLLTGDPIFNLVAWWAGFLLLTIFAERLELNRIMRPPERARHLFLGLALLWITGVALIYLDRKIGWAVASAALIVQALWLFRYDVARRTIKGEGWTRYSAFSLLAGYVWLVGAGLFGFWHGLPYAGLSYDAQLHMIFVGFVFSMIFAHAPVIIPSLSGRAIPYHPFFYVPLLLLHGFLLVRIIGDMAQLQAIRQIGGYGNVLAILLFLGSIVYGIRKQALAGKVNV